MCVTDHHDMTLPVKVALNTNTTNQPTSWQPLHLSMSFLSFIPVLFSIFFPSHRLLSYINIDEMMITSDGGILALTITKPVVNNRILPFQALLLESYLCSLIMIYAVCKGYLSHPSKFTMMYTFTLSLAGCGWLTHYQMTKFLDWSKLKQVADDILKCI